MQYQKAQKNKQGYIIENDGDDDANLFDTWSGQDSYWESDFWAKTWMIKARHDKKNNIENRVSQPWYCWHFGSGNSLLGEAVLYTLECLLVPLTSTHWMSLSFLKLWHSASLNNTEMTNLLAF